MSNKTLSFAPADMDWKPLEAILSGEALGEWMWMHCNVSPDTGAVVHFYKHVWSRRYLRIDAQGRVYRERADGTPQPLPACGGGMLVTMLMWATAPYGDGMPDVIRLPNGAREPTRIDAIPALADVCELVAADLFRTVHDIESRRAIRTDSQPPRGHQPHDEQRGI